MSVLLIDLETLRAQIEVVWLFWKQTAGNGKRPAPSRLPHPWR